MEDKTRVRKTWVQHPITYELIPKEQYVRPKIFHSIHGEIEAFVSPVDGTVISSRKQLAEHNHRHGVVSVADMGNEGQSTRQQREDYYAGRPHDTERRKDAIKHAVDWHKDGRSQADIHQMAENYRKQNR